MGVFVTLVRQRPEDHETYIDHYIVEEKGVPEEQFREAIYDFLLTDEGKEAIEDSSEDYNWGDAVLTVPSVFWEKYGIKEVSVGDLIRIEGFQEITVDQDEILIPDEYWES